MSVDVSGKRFTVPREITASGNFLTVKFYVKDMPIPRSLYNRISWYSGTPNELKYYREGDNVGVVVYSAGEWVSDAYYDIFSKITFATGAALTDSEYEWLTSFAVEETLYLAEGDSLGKVANAIRDRSWAVGMYNFPDGFDAAIRAIGNYYTGGTVAWNQQVSNGNFATTSGWSGYGGNIAASDNILSYTITSLNNNTYQNVAQRTVSIGGYNHKILCMCDVKLAHTASIRMWLNGNGENVNVIMGTGVADEWTKVGGIINRTKIATTLQVLARNPVSSGYSLNDIDYIKNVNVIDLTLAFGSAIADYLYALETDTAGAGLAKFRELFPDDYYPYQATPVLMSFKPGDWPVNAGTELRGILTLDGEGWHMDADELNTTGGTAIRRWYSILEMDDAMLNWQYNNTYDYFYANGLYNLSYAKINDDSPIVFITDAYPTGGMILSTQGPADMTDGYIYQKSNESYSGMYKGINFYVKDTSITSDHLNTFMTKIAGKKLVVKKQSASWYIPS